MATLVKVQKWGNSIALGIPKSFAKQTSIESGSSVDLIIRDGKLIIEPVTLKSYHLKDLLSEVKETNLHHEYLNDQPREVMGKLQALIVQSR